MTGRIGSPLIRRTLVGSTMDEVAALAAAGTPEGTTVLADEQTTGRGRAGRSWNTPPGTAILLSVLLRPPAPMPAARLGALPLVVGVAVAETLEAEGLRPRLKWPNDVWLDGRKVAGILTRARGGPAPVVVVGIGLNVNTLVEDLPDGATSLLVQTGRPHDRERLVSVLLDRLDEAYRGFLTAPLPNLDGWRRRAALVGERVGVEDGDRRLTGKLLGVGDDGALLLGRGDGEVTRVVAGDVTRGPRRVARVDANLE